MKEDTETDSEAWKKHREAQRGKWRQQKGKVTNVSISSYREINFVSVSEGEDKQ
jgi:hypothetical protein